MACILYFRVDEASIKLLCRWQERQCPYGQSELQYEGGYRDTH